MSQTAIVVPSARKQKLGEGGGGGGEFTCNRLSSAFRRPMVVEVPASVTLLRPMQRTSALRASTVALSFSWPGVCTMNRIIGVKAGAQLWQNCQQVQEGVWGDAIAETTTGKSVWDAKQVDEGGLGWGRVLRLGRAVELPARIAT